MSEKERVMSDIREALVAHLERVGMGYGLHDGLKREVLGAWADAILAEFDVAPPTVKPSVEALADALAAEGIDCEPGELDLTHMAERLLAMLPGRTEAEVKAEAWDEVADYLDRTNAPSIAEATRRDNPYRKEQP